MIIEYLKVIFFFFCIGLFGVLGTKRHLILILIAFELVLVSIGVILVVTSVYLDDIMGLFFVIILYTVGAAESAMGLTLLVLFYKLNGSVATDYVYKLGEHYVLYKG